LGARGRSRGRAGLPPQLVQTGLGRARPRAALQGPGQGRTAGGPDASGELGACGTSGLVVNVISLAFRGPGLEPLERGHARPWVWGGGHQSQGQGQRCADLPPHSGSGFAPGTCGLSQGFLKHEALLEEKCLSKVTVGSPAWPRS
jgi:hypothetical protein